MQEKILHIQILVNGIHKGTLFFLKILIIRFNDIWDGKVMKQFIEKYGVLSNYIIFK